MLMDDSNELHSNAAVSIACLRVGNDPSQGFDELIGTHLYPQGYTSKSATDCGVFISQARGCASQQWRSYYSSMR